MTEAESARGSRLREELRKYALISAYLFVCFGVILLYESSILQASGSDPLAGGDGDH